MTAIRRLAAFAADHPKGAVSRAHEAIARRAFLDTMGCMVLGAAAPVTRFAIGAAASWGAGRAPVYGTDRRLPAPWAALANGASAHAYDLDDFTLVANDHPSAVLAPALLAWAASAATPPAGEAMIDAYLIGLEVIFRLGAALNMGHYNLGWHTTATLDSFGAVAAIARLEGLDAQKTAMALALTPSLGSGFVSQFGSSAKPLHAGWSAKTGIVAAALAREGASAHDGALDGPVSVQSLMTPAGSARFAEALEGLGAVWGVDRFGLGAKLYPSCGYTHRAIDAGRAIHARLGPIRATSLQSAALSLPTHHLAILPYHVPDTTNQALFSPAWCAATALATGHCVSEDFEADALARPETRALAEKIAVTARAPLRPEINVDPDDPDTLKLVFEDGSAVRETMARWTGAPGKEMSARDVRQKFEDCCARAGVADPAALEDAMARFDLDAIARSARRADR